MLEPNYNYEQLRATTTTTAKPATQNQVTTAYCRASLTARRLLRSQRQPQRRLRRPTRNPGDAEPAGNLAFTAGQGDYSDYCRDDATADGEGQEPLQPRQQKSQNDYGNHNQERPTTAPASDNKSRHCDATTEEPTTTSTTTEEPTNYNSSSWANDHSGITAEPTATAAVLPAPTTTA